LQPDSPNVRRSRSSFNSLPPDIEKTVDEFVDHLSNIGIEGLKHEFTSVSQYRCPDELYKHEAFLANSDKNRYNDVVCLDATRVVLHHEVPPLTDYIHANWVKFEKHDRIFIMTQAPLESTIGDFWRMVFQENCPSIVNLTQPIEIENMKCVPYWPMESGSFNTYDKMFVNTKKVK
ncbi:Protein-tyrosine phosphatase, partial [Cooperia oncophora]